MNFNDVKHDSNPLSRFTKGTLIASLIGATATLALILIFSTLLTFTGISDKLISVFGYLSVATGSFISGYLSSRKVRHQGILNGLACAAFILISVFICKLLFGGATSFTAKTFGSAALTAIFCIVGGIAGINTKFKK